MFVRCFDFPARTRKKNMFACNSFLFSVLFFILINLQVRMHCVIFIDLFSIQHTNHLFESVYRFFFLFVFTLLSSLYHTIRCTHSDLLFTSLWFIRSFVRSFVFFCLLLLFFFAIGATCVSLCSPHRRRRLNK